jgi:hypothetical protein
MAEKISWKECVDKKIVTRAPQDLERSKQTLKMAILRLEFWSKKIEDKYNALKIEAYYDIIKELIFAHMYKNGYNCINHLCLIAYLKEKFNDFEYETEKVDELRKIRNEINYRGTQIQKDYLERNELEFKNIISQLRASLQTPV